MFESLAKEDMSSLSNFTNLRVFLKKTAIS